MIRVNLTGHMPVLEYRFTSGRYFVTYPSLGLELMMAFEEEVTAQEIGLNTYLGTPFFTSIPTAPYDTPYPRPGFFPPQSTKGYNIGLIRR